MVLNETIKHENGKWNLYTKDGSKKLGSHPSKEKALAQERAIYANKAKHATNEEQDVSEQHNNNSSETSYPNNNLQTESLRNHLYNLIINTIKTLNK